MRVRVVKVVGVIGVVRVMDTCLYVQVHKLLPSVLVTAEDLEVGVELL